MRKYHGYTTQGIALECVQKKSFTGALLMIDVLLTSESVPPVTQRCSSYRAACDPIVTATWGQDLFLLRNVPPHGCYTADIIVPLCYYPTLKVDNLQGKCILQNTQACMAIYRDCWPNLKRNPFRMRTAIACLHHSRGTFLFHHSDEPSKI